MNLKSITYYLEDPERLSEISIQDLVQWIEKEPYNQNLRFLLAKKHIALGQKTDMNPFYLAGTYAYDRQRLREYLNDIDFKTEAKALLESLEDEAKAELGIGSQNRSLEETSIEKKPSSLNHDLTEESDPVKHETGEVAPTEENAVKDPLEDDIVWILEKAERKALKKKKNKKKKAKTKAKGFKKKEATEKSISMNQDIETLKTESNASNTEKSIPSEELDNEIEGLSPYAKWLMTLRTEGGKHDIPYTDWSSYEVKRVKKEYVDPRDLEIESMAQKSLENDVENISEPLANVLLAQGHIKQAQVMYQKLSLKYPDKSAYFAAKIKELEIRS